MKKKISRILQIILFICLSIGLLYLAFRKIDVKLVLAEIMEADYRWLVLSFSFSIFAFISRARRWILIIRPMGYRPGLKNTYHSLLTGYLVNFGLPRMGEFTRCLALSRKEKIPVDGLFGTVIAERAFDFLSMLLILLLTLVLRNTMMNDFLRNYVLNPIGNKIGELWTNIPLLLIITAVMALVTISVILIYRKKLPGYILFEKITGFVKGIAAGLKAFTSIDRKVEFILHTVFIWLNYTLMTWVILFMIPETSQLGFADAIFLLVIGSLGMAAPVQGGIGAFHWIISRGLLVVYDISLENGLAYATLSHESQLILIAILGTISSYFIFRKNKKTLTSVHQSSVSNG